MMSKCVHLSEFINRKAVCGSLTADSRILVVGTIAAGKSHLISSMNELGRAIFVHSIDDYRVKHDASTVSGEANARNSFLSACSEQNGIFEFTGGGPLFNDVKLIAFLRPFDFVIRVHAPTDICLQRISVRTSWPPYPNDVMPDSNLIEDISYELDENGFGIEVSEWIGQELIHVAGVGQ